MSETIERHTARPPPPAASRRPDFSALPAYVEPARPPARITRARTGSTYSLALLIVTAVTVVFFGLHFSSNRTAWPDTVTVPQDRPMPPQHLAAPQDVPLPTGLQIQQPPYASHPPPPNRPLHPARVMRPSNG